MVRIYEILGRACAVIAMSCLCQMPVSAQFVNKEVMHAVHVLKNLDKDMTKAEAIKILKKATKTGDSPYASNCLGLAYMQGNGVERDTVLAVSYLEQAGAEGYSDAYHNLGMMYKNEGGGVRQDMCKAYRYFCMGAERKSVACMYDKGFMQYKGMGCEQDYAVASDLFYAAGIKRHSPSLYMLGLCYRNGYGVARDSVMAMACLSKAAELGYKDAKEEMERPLPENCLGEDTSQSSGIRDINSPVNDMSLLSGAYQGVLVKYDWSGRYVLEEKPMVMTISDNTGRAALGRMVIGNDTVPFVADLSTEDRICFSSSRIRREERYNPDRLVTYKVEKAIVDVWENSVCGRLSLYDLNHKEPERPMWFELYRERGAQSSSVSRNEIFKVSPNPFVTAFSASFELSSAEEVTVRLFNRYGMLVWQKSVGRLDAGRQSIDVVSDIPAGTYVVNVKAGKQVFRGLVIKKGGER